MTLKSDRFLISPYNINPELHIKVLRRKEMIIDKKKKCDCYTNSPRQHIWKFIENSWENKRILMLGCKEFIYTHLLFVFPFVLFCRSQTL